MSQFQEISLNTCMHGNQGRSEASEVGGGGCRRILPEI
jgi:hypothetical protein